MRFEDAQRCYFYDVRANMGPRRINTSPNCFLFSFPGKFIGYQAYILWGILLLDYDALTPMLTEAAFAFEWANSRCPHLRRIH